MIKKILCVFLFASAVMTHATNSSYLTIELKTGNKYSFLLADKPVVSFNSGDLVVNGNSTTSYAIGGVKNYYFTEFDQTAIESVATNNLQIDMIDYDNLEVRNAVASANITLVNASGVICFSTIADYDGAAIIYLPKQKGIYILSIGNQSFKIVQK